QDGFELKVTGILRPSKDADTQMLTGAIGYTHMLTEYVIEEASKAEVVSAQKNSPTVDVLTGLPFKENTGNLSAAEKKTALLSYIETLSVNEKSDFYLKVKSVMDEDDLEAQTNAMLSMPQMQNKDLLKMQIAAALSNQTGMSVDQINAYLDDMTLQQLHALLTPTIQQGIKERYAQGVETQLEGLTAEEKANLLDSEKSSYTDEQASHYYDNVMVFSNSSFEDNMVLFGCLDIDSPKTINIYASSFDKKDIIENAIKVYNDSVTDEASKISYTDYVGLMMSSVTQIIDAVTYVLIAFVAISLIVSSIMIGVITLISVQERTKEIGVLRAIGASKRNVSSMFNAETIIIGFISGTLGVVVTYLLCIPINIILNALTGLTTLKAVLPIPAALILVAISVCLTLFSGIIPSRSASKKDPVVALRTE
ncbi:MAG: ABC transporter permease, partial [Clostridiales bacterium]|nr:ABC transporter permease [Clostridiales bacterium]